MVCFPFCADLVDVTPSLAPPLRLPLFPVCSFGFITVIAAVEGLPLAAL